VETQQHQQLVVWVEQEQILVQIIQVHQIVEHMLAVVAAVQQLQAVLEELVVEVLQVTELKHQEMQQPILVVAVEEQ
tara:strand:- start:86 stop:316 length:231 start_codon:yes stop_codon:yes gene_type:complete